MCTSVSLPLSEPEGGVYPPKKPTTDEREEGVPRGEDHFLCGWECEGECIIRRGRSEGGELGYPQEET